MIRITRLTDYGIVLLSRFASGEPGRLFSARELGEATKIPQPTVSKLLKALTRAGLLESQRGTQGGYQLARAPRDVSVADVIHALEGPIALTDCTDEGAAACDIEHDCPVSSNWQRITRAVLGALEAIPLTEMASPFSEAAERAARKMASGVERYLADVEARKRAASASPEVGNGHGNGAADGVEDGIADPDAETTSVGDLS
jgi:FeS assembly SUF system regulator